MKQILRLSFVALMAMIMGNAFAQGTIFNFDDDYATLFPTITGVSSGSGDSYVADGDFTEATTSTAIDGFTVTVSAAAEGNNSANRIWGSSPRLRMYSGTLTVKGTGIKKIEFTSNSKFNLSTETGTLDGTTWTGEADEVVFTVGGNTQLKSLVINAEGSGEEVHIANTKETAYTIAKAIELIDAGKALDEEVYVKGMISQIDKFNSDGSITYWISDDGSTTSQFECYKGKGKDGADFTSIEDLKKGATVIVKGLLKKYNAIYEFDAGNVLIDYDESTVPAEEVHIANTKETAYTVAKAIELIDAGDALTEEVYVKGMISQIDKFNSDGSITYWISDDGTTTNQFECYKGKGKDGANFASVDDLKKGSTVIVKGLLKKYNTTYEFDAGNVLVDYDESTAVEEKHIANTEETAYTVAQAIELINAGESLQETVYVKGIISQIDKYKENYKSIDYWISDDGTTENQFECYSGKGLNGADFESIDDIEIGATVIVKGTIKKYGDIYEFNQSNELVKYEAPATGIQNMKVQKTEGVIYNLAGQRVEKATKGIYIQNGKKFIVK